MMQQRGMFGEAFGNLTSKFRESITNNAIMSIANKVFGSETPWGESEGRITRELESLPKGTWDPVSNSMISPQEEAVEFFSREPDSKMSGILGFFRAMFGGK